ncbi:MAG: DUF932 domain-containing protein [Fimbriimonas sp.]
MNPTIDFDDVRQLIEEDDVGKWDAQVHPKKLYYANGQLSWEDKPPVVPTDWAEGQLCHKLGIPLPYFRRCPDALRSEQVAHWMFEEAKRRPGVDGAWCLRCRGDSLRATLSGRFAPFDNRALVEAAGECKAAGLQVDVALLTDESFHLRLLAPSRGRNVLPDDRLIVGVHVANSEVGRRSVTLDALVYRLVCGNGLVRLVKGRSLLKRRHISRWLAPVGELAAAVREAMEIASHSIDRMEETTEVHVPDMPAFLRRAVESAGLPERVAEDAEKAVLTERSAMQETLFAAINGLTNAAQRLPADERYELEATAGKLLEGNGLASLRDRPRAIVS